MTTLDRAIAFCQSTLAYGKASEQPALITTVDLARLVEEVAELLMLSAETDPILEYHIPGGLGVLADPDHLSRVLTNLLRNARAALEGQPASPERVRVIRILAEADDRHCRIRVLDNGPGISTGGA